MTPPRLLKLTAEPAPESATEKLIRLTGKNSPQHAFNAFLWMLVRNNGGTLTVKGMDLKDIPNKATLKGDWDEKTESLVIRSVMNHGKIQTHEQGIVH